MCEIQPTSNYLIAFGWKKTNCRGVLVATLLFLLIYWV